MTEILILAEHRAGALRDVTFEALGLARQLGGHEVVALLLEGAPSGSAEQLAQAADRVLVARDAAFAEYDPSAYLSACAEVMTARAPALTLIGHTANGMDLAPALAAQLELPLVTDCLSLSLSGGALTARRQVYGGKLEAKVELKPAERYVATLRPGNVEAATGGGAGAVEELATPRLPSSPRRRLVRHVVADIQDVDIADAEFLVSVGRGVGKAENMDSITAFADKIGATLACSRPVADKGWLPKSRQVGTSGKTVRPRVYLALGISGAYQHVAGMKGADTIIAVNRDPDAPIFEVAHYGIVADMFEVLPQLEAKLTAAR